jgi:hypothetical protein
MSTRQISRSTLLSAWVIVLLTSALPRIILQEIFSMTVSLEMQAVISISVVIAAMLASFAWQPLRSLRPLLILFMVLIAAQWLVYTRLDTIPFFQQRLSNPSFNIYMLAEQSLNLVVTLVIIAALLLMKKKRADFFLARGDIAAPAEQVRWLGIDQGDRWNRIGVMWTVFISLGTLAFLVIAGRPPLNIVIQALPFLPVILLAAALNAFNEEVTYKASLLSVLESPVGPRQALLMVAAYFGVAHFYGVPYGVIGVLMAGFLGWFLAKSMQETRGLFWAWFIHFWQDVWIFSFMAIGSISPGGG